MGHGRGGLWHWLCEFKTERTIAFVHPALGIPYKLLCGVIVYWIVTTLLNTELFLAKSFPVGVFDVSILGSHASTGTDYARAQQLAFEKLDEAASPCARLDAYAFGDFKQPRCKFLPLVEVGDEGESRAFVTTAYQDVYRSSFELAQGESCNVAAFRTKGMGDYCIDSDTTRVEKRLGECFCEAKKSYIVPAAEAVAIALDHTFRSKFEDGKPERTYIRIKGEEETIMELDEGETVVLAVNKLLELLELDLDKGEKPLRSYGVEIQVDVNYYNFGQIPVPGLEKKFQLTPGNVLCLIELSVRGAEEGEGETTEAIESAAAPSAETSTARHAIDEKPAAEKPAAEEAPPESKESRLGAEGETDEEENKPYSTVAVVSSADTMSAPFANGSRVTINRHRTGVNVVFTASGLISELDHALLFETFIQAFLLLNIANMFCQFVAYNLLGDKSRIFKEFGEHVVSYSAEYARFAVQAIVSGMAFRKLDADGSGELDHGEICAAIKENTGDEFTEDEIDTLAHFIIQEGDTEGGGDGKISVAEWDDLFASGYADFEHIKKTIRNFSAREREAMRLRVAKLATESTPLIKGKYGAA